MERLIAAEKGEPFKDALDMPSKLSHEVNYAIRTWLDHRKHGSYPKPGGYDRQCPFLMADWHTLSLYHSRVENGDYVSMTLPTDAPDISTLME